MAVRQDHDPIAALFVHLHTMWHLERIPKRTYRLIGDGGKELGRLEYPSRWSHRAEILVADGLYEAKPKGVFRSGVVVTLHERPVAELTFSWNSLTVTYPGPPERSVCLSRRSIWKSYYELFDGQGAVLAGIKAKASFRTMAPDLSITEMGERLPDPLDVLLAVHGTIVRHRQMAAAVVAT